MTQNVLSVVSFPNLNQTIKTRICTVYMPQSIVGCKMLNVIQFTCMEHLLFVFLHTFILFFPFICHLLV